MRTTIERAADGNILVTREAPRKYGISGTSQDRRRAKKRGDIGNPWFKVERNIFRGDTVLLACPTGLQPGSEFLPINQSDMLGAAAENELTTYEHKRAAAAICAIIDSRTASRAAQSPPKRRVARVVYDEVDE